MRMHVKIIRMQCAETIVGAGSRVQPTLHWEFSFSAMMMTMTMTNPFPPIHDAPFHVPCIGCAAPKFSLDYITNLIHIRTRYNVHSPMQQNNFSLRSSSRMADSIIFISTDIPLLHENGWNDFYFATTKRKRKTQPETSNTGFTNGNCIFWFIAFRSFACIFNILSCEKDTRNVIYSVKCSVLEQMDSGRCTQHPSIKKKSIVKVKISREINR